MQFPIANASRFQALFSQANVFSYVIIILTFFFRKKTFRKQRFFQLMRYRPLCSLCKSWGDAVWEAIAKWNITYSIAMSLFWRKQKIWKIAKNDYKYHRCDPESIKREIFSSFRILEHYFISTVCVPQLSSK